MTRVVQSIFHQLRTNFVNTAFESLVKTASDLQALTKARPRLAIALGTGQSHALDSLVEHTHRVSYQELYAGAAPQALSHRGELTLGTINGCSVAVFSGRLHLYEGHSALAICQNVIFAKLLGCNEFLFTNAAGALNQAYTPGDVMILSDHLNLTGENPLIAAPAAMAEHFRIEHPFVDMSQPYDSLTSDFFNNHASELSITTHNGVYAGLKGPSLETSAERRMLATLGADAVGMSTVNEVIMSRYLGLTTTAFCAITNMATGGPDQQEDSIEQILEYADEAGAKIAQLIEGFCAKRAKP
jgi:purine-nucleoside phosphorylase